MEKHQQPQSSGFGARLVLAGVVHRDPEGPDRLWTFLATRRPQGVSVELSKYSLSFRRANRERLGQVLDENLKELARQRKLDGPEPLEVTGHVRSMRRAIGIPYEYEVAASYCRRYDAQRELVDLSRTSRDRLEELEELTSLANLTTLLARPDLDRAAEARRQRAVAKRLLAKKSLDSTDWPVAPDPDAATREMHMERQIRQAINRSRCSLWIHVGGWEHLLAVEGRPTLYTRLVEMSPQRLLI
ncbi:MAG: hypothetical protein HY815_23770 [Candidatus Riflebacteria bacterium]|nr:hypothetical protein [Candidatus Riflebacteria bacterium]